MHKDTFFYDLPENRIAKFPVSPRHNSKLLLYKNGQISDYHFYDLPNLLPIESLIVMNNAKVIPARIICKKKSGAFIEVFLLQPLGEYLQAFAAKKFVDWKVMIGNKSRWKSGEILDLSQSITVNWIARENNTVRLSWNDDAIFSEVLEKAGQLPIPPYLKRDSNASDKEDYQTAYAKILGAVAAPTAGLHFTSQVLAQLKAKNIDCLEATLHVGAGTFKPIAEDDIRNHSMHAENFEVNKIFIQKLIQNQKTLIAVGTTSLRILESLYILGCNIANKISNPQIILQHHTSVKDLDFKASLALILAWLENESVLKASTQIYLYPGKKIYSINGLITNFHQPDSTLMPLIATCIGNDWKKIYTHALQQDYRFLSYGDSSLLWLNPYNA